MVCRRWPTSSWRRETAASEYPRSGYVQRAHVLIDATELSLRLAFTCWRLRVGSLAHSRTAGLFVLTDRSPLDGLVKFDVLSGSLPARWLTRIARQYERIIWLDTSADVLAIRDGEHSEAELERMRRAFGEWAPRLPNVVRVDTSRRTAGELARSALQTAGWYSRDPDGPGD
jgi:hypothetical protein